MAHMRPLFFFLALGLASSASFAATDTNHSDHKAPATQGETAGDGSSVNSPGGSKGNDSSDTGSNSDAADGSTGGSSSTGEATGSGAGATGGSAEDQDSR
ncbi:hypothetical protein VA602_21625 [Pseudomonas sp. MH2]|uniref:Serine protease autotransporter n=1 Tax=Pseudomonas machongensis TaxID=3110229 RepID=A0ABU5VKN1_9PSED|nr:hypothetical protein [Pseudomonas sp. MH2]MEA5673924.1 hypothetical protein [Pseudomonas sp. MH2]